MLWEVPDLTACAVDADFYHPNGAATRLVVADTAQRQRSHAHRHQRESDWSDRVVDYVEQLMDNPQYRRGVPGCGSARGCISSGVVDGVTSQPDHLPAAEQQAMDARYCRPGPPYRREPPREPSDFIVINNFWTATVRSKRRRGVRRWHLLGTPRLYPAGGYHATYLQKPFSDLGHRRRHRDGGECSGMR